MPTVFFVKVHDLAVQPKKILSVHIIIIGLLNSIVNDDTFDPLILNMVHRIEVNEDVTGFFATQNFHEIKFSDSKVLEIAILKNLEGMNCDFGEFVQYFQAEFLQNQHSMLSNSSNW